MDLYNLLSTKFTIFNATADMGVRRNFSRGRQRPHFAFRFHVADDAMKWTFTKRLTFLRHKEKSPCYKNSHKKRASLAVIILSSMLLFTQDETTGLTAIRSHCLAALPAKDVCVQQSRGKTPPTVT